MTTLPPFHLAIAVDDLDSNRVFYRDVLGCTEGRNSDYWVDFNFFGHQLVIHLKEGATVKKDHSNPVDGKQVPIPHFGIVLNMEIFEALSKKLIEKSVTFIIAPYTRFKGEVGEQATMFFKDPAGNTLEFKAFKNKEQLFAK